MDKRLRALQSWLIDELQLNLQQINPASADASFRRYFRINIDSGKLNKHLNNIQHNSLIVMDAPPNKEPIDEFVRINQALAKQHIHVPHIYRADHTQGFILLEDLGDTVFLEQLNTKTAQTLYFEALHALIKLQQGTQKQPDFKLPNYSADLLQQEMALFDTWYVQRHLGKTLDPQHVRGLHKTQNLLVETCLEQPQVWVHRDYHSRNLMVTTKNSPGVIDFQDMVLGPISYDLVSLFKDCYITWSRQQQLEWLKHYCQLANSKLDSTTLDFEQLIRWYDFTGLQRHLKVLGIFCRLNYRDGKPHYLNDLPMVVNYVQEVCDLYTELSDLKQLIVNLK